MKKKWVIISLVFIIIIIFSIFISLNKLHYPSLPIESITPKEAIQKLNESNQKLAEISKENEVTWYIIKNTEDVNGNIEHFVSSNGWVLQKIEGNSLFFEKGNEILIVSTEMWTNKYRLVKVPSNFRNG
ncbi:hypothetical protein VC38_14290 (plasmid) [Listeria innocua]|uniref:hypothetical protein n=1 Tax=Listeria innocua TaxID=1642 RepID=UPI0005EF3D26|nr:hypothetical protein [Listeria innocua]EIE7361931.1 hypothetical protein [Listeria monocytogenes]EAE6209422.1 hypothetical protein [Listeria innocua]EIE7818289.1 hypothetical protein [Listeria monocytogenes]EIE7821234.1 hypothetical protein [Listeria monocytogenes]EIE8299328.1 hypothetical protein [Listeria monocytogenes]